MEKESNYDGRVAIEVWEKNSIAADKLMGCMSFTAEEIKCSPFAR